MRQRVIIGGEVTVDRRNVGRGPARHDLTHAMRENEREFREYERNARKDQGGMAHLLGAELGHKGHTHAPKSGAQQVRVPVITPQS